MLALIRGFGTDWNEADFRLIAITLTKEEMKRELNLDDFEELD